MYLASWSAPAHHLPWAQRFASAVATWIPLLPATRCWPATRSHERTALGRRSLDVSDVTPQRVEKPWGYELWWANTDAYAGKLLHVERGHKLSLQLHHQKDETSYLLSGRLRLIRGSSSADLEDQEIGPGHAWRVEPGLVHSIEAIEDALVLEVSTPHLDDVVRLEDRYGRVE